MEKFVVNVNQFEGNAHTRLDETGKCPYSGKTAAEFEAEGYQIMTLDEMRPLVETYLDGLCGKWEEITEEDFNYALDVLPPLRWHNGGFFIAEMYTHDVSNFYQQWHGHYYKSKQRLTYKRVDIVNSLVAFVVGK